VEWRSSIIRQGMLEFSLLKMPSRGFESGSVPQLFIDMAVRTPRSEKILVVLPQRVSKRNFPSHIYGR
jgi:hypothetical protein